MIAEAVNTDITVHMRTPHPKQRLFVDCQAKRIMVRAGRRSGKTTGIAIRHVNRFLIGRRQLYTAPTEDQVARFWTEIKIALAEPIEAGLLYKNEQKHIIEIPGTETRIRAKTAWNADTLRGDYADDLTFDEWQLTDEAAWNEVGAPMLLDNNGDAVFIYTPPSFHSRSTTKATDPRHAAKMFKNCQADPRWATFHFTSHENPHVSEEGLSEVVQDMSELAYRQEIMAEDVNEIPGALWKRETLDSLRVTKHPDLSRIVVGVDPPGGATECGIVVVGIAQCDCKGAEEAHAFVLEDASLKAPPDVWAAMVVSVYDNNDADRVVAEKNFGGDMVKHTIQTESKEIRYKDVSASRGKAVRAEPVSALCEQGKVHHVGRLGDLEDELCGWVPGISPKSPNRLDAYVWALTELMLKHRVKVEFA